MIKIFSIKKLVASAYLMISAGILYSVSLNAQSITGNIFSNTQFEHCGQIEYENYLRSQDSDFDKKRAEMEKTIQQSVAKFEQAKLNGNPQPFAQYTIPVVVHVVYNTAAENVSDANVTAMISQLNMDWSRTNTDAGNTPAVWQPPVAATMEIQFCLATTDPGGNPTTGIIRKQTSTVSFGFNDVQSSATGGDDPWDVYKYLNIWTCELNIGYVGYASYPPISSNYGAVLHFCTVGSMTLPGTCSPFEIGRTLSHEIGHCFSLYHIWGDDYGACTGTDGVSDTPNQADHTPSGGCLTFPKTDICSPFPPGIMFMNYMDYGADTCFNMFTEGQKTRCQSAISSYLMTIANNAATVCSPTGTNNFSLSDYISIYPNPSNGNFFMNVALPNIGLMDITVFSAVGAPVLSRKTTSHSSKDINLNLNDKPDGIYLMQVKTSADNITRKIILNRQFIPQKQ